MRGMYNVEYVPGVKECFIYIGTAPGCKTLPDFDLFNGWTTGNTISRDTIEKLKYKASYQGRLDNVDNIVNLEDARLELDYLKIVLKNAKIKQINCRIPLEILLEEELLSSTGSVSIATETF